MHQIACHLPLSFSFIYGTNSCYNLLNDNMRHLNWSAAPASPIYGRNIRFNTNYRIYVHIRLNINMVTSDIISNRSLSHIEYTCNLLNRSSTSLHLLKLIRICIKQIFDTFYLMQFFCVSLRQLQESLGYVHKYISSRQGYT